MIDAYRALYNRAGLGHDVIAVVHPLLGCRRHRRQRQETLLGPMPATRASRMRHPAAERAGFLRIAFRHQSVCHGMQSLCMKVVIAGYL